MNVPAQLQEPQMRLPYLLVPKRTGRALVNVLHAGESFFISSLLRKLRLLSAAKTHSRDTVQAY